MSYNNCIKKYNEHSKRKRKREREDLENRYQKYSISTCFTDQFSNHLIKAFFIFLLIAHKIPYSADHRYK